jgi:hypothetical protein
MTFTRIEDESKIATAYNNVISFVTKGTKPQEAVVGFHSGNMHCRVAWNIKYGFWTMYPPKDGEKQLIFGTQDPDRYPSRSLNITCQINVLRGSSGRQRAGTILWNGKDLFLGHNGGIGGGKEGVGKAAFISWYRNKVSDTVDVKNDGGHTIPYILIGKIGGSSTFLSALAKFVFAVERFKKERDDSETVDQHLSRDADEADEEGAFDPGNVTENQAKVVRAINQRRGQPVFRKKLLDAYGRRCAMSDCDCVDALEAAHIRPYGGEDTNHVQNGLLLRSDIHVLFDLGKIGVNPTDYTVIVAKEIRNTVYGELHGKPLRIPDHQSNVPNEAVLQEHRKTWDL